MARRWDKGPVCAELSITHFVDDRLDVLGYLTTVPDRLLFTGGLGMHAPAVHPPATVSVVSTWPERVGTLRARVPL